MNNRNPLVKVRHLKKYFSVSNGGFGKKPVDLKAVDDVSFSIDRGQTFGLVGESGCGKSTCARTILRLYQPTAGEMLFAGEDIFKLSNRQMKSIRRNMQMVFQDSYASLNPRMTVLDIVAEPLDVHKLVGKRERREYVEDLLELVGLNTGHLSRYPYEFSSGQRQRINIARAIATNPKFIICDEPISALDVSIRAQIINLLLSLQEKFGLTYLFITHDLSVIRYISDRIAVMYLGKIVEISEKHELYNNPVHPYTQALLSAIPVANPRIERTRQRIILEGDVPSPIDPPKGCCFRTRCSSAMSVCGEVEPELVSLGKDHMVACHLINI